jgi:hypothetical protein
VDVPSHVCGVIVLDHVIAARGMQHEQHRQITKQGKTSGKLPTWHGDRHVGRHEREQCNRGETTARAPPEGWADVMVKPADLLSTERREGACGSPGPL